MYLFSRQLFPRELQLCQSSLRLLTLLFQLFPHQLQFVMRRKSASWGRQRVATATSTAACQDIAVRRRVRFRRRLQNVMKNRRVFSVGSLPKATFGCCWRAGAAECRAVAVWRISVRSSPGNWNRREGETSCHWHLQRADLQ